MKRSTLRERLLSKAVINWDTGCWEWTANRDRKGYGSAQSGNGMFGAHRLIFELIEGPIPHGLDLDHLCRVRHCVNPAHLEPVTRRENTLRSPIAIPAINAVKTHCNSGHEFTAGNTHVNSQGHRRCRACNRAAVARYKARKSVPSTQGRAS